MHDTTHTHTHTHTHKPETATNSKTAIMKEHTNVKHMSKNKNEEHTDNQQSDATAAARDEEIQLHKAKKTKRTKLGYMHKDMYICPAKHSGIVHQNLCGQAAFSKEELH